MDNTNDNNAAQSPLNSTIEQLEEAGGYDDLSSFQDPDDYDDDLNQIQNHYDMPLEDLKASFLQFSNDMNNNNNNQKKKSKQKKRSGEAGAANKAPRMSTRDELTQSLQAFQAKMNVKLQKEEEKEVSKTPKGTNNNDDEDGSDASLEQPPTKDVVLSSRQFSEAESSVATDAPLSPSLIGQVIPMSFRTDSSKDSGLDLYPETTSTPEASERTEDLPSNSNNAQVDGDASEGGLEALNEEEEEGASKDDSRPNDATPNKALSKTSTPSFAEDELDDLANDNDDNDLSESSIYEEPLPPVGGSPTREETMEGLRKFHRSLSKQNLSLTVHPANNNNNKGDHESHSSSDTEQSEPADPPKMESIKSLLRDQDDVRVSARQLTAKHRASELERQTVEMSKEDLFSSLKAFQSQLDHRLHSKTATATTTAVRTRQKRASAPNRHRSVEVEAAPPSIVADKRGRRGSMIAMHKMDSKRSVGGVSIGASQSEDGDCPTTPNKRDIEDQNFRRWFESKMEGRTGDGERFVLEEDDHGEGVVEDKGHGPLVVNVLGGETPHAQESPQSDDTNDDHHKHHSHEQEEEEEEDTESPQNWTSIDRATQIKERNNQMSRDEIKASLLQFQSQLNTRASVAKKPKANVNASTEFRLPEPEPKFGVKTRLAQIEKRNETLSRDQLTASLMAFKSNIEKKVAPKGENESGASKKAKPKLAKVPEKSLEKPKPAADVKANDAFGDRNNIRRNNGTRQDRIKMLEAEQATIPRDVMIASLQKFRSDIHGKMNAGSTDVSLDGKPVRKVTRLEAFDAITENTSMEVTEDDFLNKVVGNITEKKQEQGTTDKAQDGSRQEMMKNLLSFQTEIQGKIAKKTTVSGKAVSGESASQTDGASLGNETSDSENSGHPRKFESMLRNLEDLKKRNEEKVSTMQNLDRIRKRNEEKVSAMISALSPEEATEMPPWFAEFAQQQENKFQELVQISEQRNKEIMRLSNDSARSQVRSVSPQIVDEKKNDLSQTSSLEQREKWQRNAPDSSGLDRPGQFMGYPPHEDQETVGDADMDVKWSEASHFIQRFAQETGLLNGKRLEERLEEVKSSIVESGSYTQSYDELQYGCRLAWRNCGRFIMRSAYSNLTVRDCRQVKTADDCFNECVKHLKDVFDHRSESPVISVFHPKGDGKFSPVRIWNRELLGYAGYKRDDGTIMGDSSNLEFTAFCVKFGWIPPEVKSDFDILPLLISDEARGHDNPKVFNIPQESIHEVELEHPNFDLLKNLNLRWFAQASDASMGVDIGGMIYQSAPFTRLYQATEISSFLLDGSRYGFAAAIAAACAVRKTHLSLWRDDVQLQTQKSILNSFAGHGLLCIDHHSVSEDFVQFYSSEIQDFGSCPADWEHVVAPATSSMTGAYHQEMTNFLVKPQYLDQKPAWDELNLSVPQPVAIAAALRRKSSAFRNEKCKYDHVFVYYASETGASLRLATLLAGDFGGQATGPIPLDNLPDLLLESVEKQSLVLIVTSTASSGTPPLHAKNFLGGMRQVPKGSLHSIDFAICALCNSAYIESLASFAFTVEANLKRAGCVPTMGIHYVDYLNGTEEAFTDFRTKLFEESEGILYKRNPEVESVEPKRTQPVTMTFENLVPVLKQNSIDGPGAFEEGSYLDTWERNSNVLKRSLDLFRFKIEGEEEDDENRLNGLAAGDHVALYPRNMNDVVETLLRHINAADDVGTREYLRKSKDLSKPLSFDELSFLRDYILGNERAMGVLDEILTNASHDSSLSVEKLVQIMPPGSIPMKWILKYVPSMDPRFYSIASIDGKKKTMSIVQSVYTFEGTQKAGVASRWLRSLVKGQKVNAMFTKTNFQLPLEDEGAPVVLISAGPAIAPCRTFWLSGRRNPTYLFCGCKSPEDLPFSTEIDLLKKKGLLHPFIAYTHNSNNKMELESLLRRERATLLELLHNSRTRLYVCGSPEVDAKVRNSLAMILAQGHSHHRGMGMARAMDKLALMSQTKRYVREIYGNAVGDTRRSDPTYAMWQESTVKVVRALAALEKLQVPIAPSSPRHNSRQKRKMNEESLAYNPMISGGA